MGILLGHQIENDIKSGKIKIEPFNPNNIAINSIDVTILNKLVTYKPIKLVKTKNGTVAMIDKEKLKEMDAYCEILDDIIIDPQKNNEIFEIKIPKDGIILMPNILYLGSTVEKAGSDYYIPMYEGRSSKARLGMQSHISAGFGDLGFKSNWTLEITVTQPLKVYPNERVGQVYFMEADDKEVLLANEMKRGYNGKYKDQTEPQASKNHEDF